MIDWKVIAEFEGGDRTTAYVPDPEGSRSGVTIAAGVDIGNIGAGVFAQFPEALQAKFRPYRGLRGQEAADFLAANPLTISDAEAAEVDGIARADVVAGLAARFNAMSRCTMRFAELPDAAQTVIASVTFQYGTPWKRCPHFWECAVEARWSDMAAVLNDFGDKYQKRRKAEAAYLQAGLPS